MLRAKEIFLCATGSPLWSVWCLSDSHSVWFMYRDVLWYYCTSYVVLHCVCQQTEELEEARKEKVILEGVTSVVFSEPAGDYSHLPDALHIQEHSVSQTWL